MVARVDSLQPVEFFEDFEVVTWSSYDYPTLVERCLTALGVPVTVLRPKGEWTNVQKIHLIVEHLQKSKAKYVIGLDADDVILTESPDVIIKRWKEAYPESKLLYNGGFRQWPRRSCPPTRPCDKFENANFKGNAKHLNAGVWVGEREYALDFYREVQAVERDVVFHTKFRYMEQPSVRTCAFPSRYPEIMVDTGNIVFQHMLRGVSDCKVTSDYTDVANKRLVYYDLGAFDGRTTLNFVYAHNPDKVWAFEPSEINTQSEYWRIIQSTYADYVKRVPSAVWTEDCDVKFYMPATGVKSQCCSMIESKTIGELDKENPVMVEAVNFNDFFVKRHKNNDFTIVKMDIEGAEYNVLDHLMATDTLAKVDELRIEYHGNKMDGDYSEVEARVSEYCKLNDVNLLEMDH
jgi:FkbM family methyltransferase